MFPFILTVWQSKAQVTTTQVGYSTNAASISALLTDDNDNTYAIGSFRGTLKTEGVELPGNPALSRIALIKYNKDGNIIYSRQIGIDSFNCSISGAAIAADRIAIAYQASAIAGSPAVVKYQTSFFDTSGTLLNTKELSQRPRQIIATGNYFHIFLSSIDLASGFSWNGIPYETGAGNIRSINSIYNLQIDKNGQLLNCKNIRSNNVVTLGTLRPVATERGFILQANITGDSVWINDSLIVRSNSSGSPFFIHTDSAYKKIHAREIPYTGPVTYAANNQLYMVISSASTTTPLFSMDNQVYTLANRNLLVIFDSAFKLKTAFQLSEKQLSQGTPRPNTVDYLFIASRGNQLRFLFSVTGKNEYIDSITGHTGNWIYKELFSGIFRWNNINGQTQYFLVSTNTDLQQSQLMDLKADIQLNMSVANASNMLLDRNSRTIFNGSVAKWNPWFINSNLQQEKGLKKNYLDGLDITNRVESLPDGSAIIAGIANGKLQLDNLSEAYVNVPKNDLFFARINQSGTPAWIRKINSSFSNSILIKLIQEADRFYFLVKLTSPINELNYIRIDEDFFALGSNTEATLFGYFTTSGDIKILSHPYKFKPATFPSLPIPVGKNVVIRVTAPKNTNGDLFLSGNFEGWTGGGNPAYKFTKLSDTTFYFIAQLDATSEFKITRGSWDNVMFGINGLATENMKWNGKTVMDVVIFSWRDKEPVLSESGFSATTYNDVNKVPKTNDFMFLTSYGSAVPVGINPTLNSGTGMWVFRTDSSLNIKSYRKISGWTTTSGIDYNKNFVMLDSQTIYLATGTASNTNFFIDDGSRYIDTLSFARENINYKQSIIKFRFDGFIWIRSTGAEGPANQMSQTLSNNQPGRIASLAGQIVMHTAPIFNNTRTVYWGDSIIASNINGDLNSFTQSFSLLDTNGILKKKIFIKKIFNIRSFKPGPNNNSIIIAGYTTGYNGKFYGMDIDTFSFENQGNADGFAFGLDTGFNIKKLTSISSPFAELINDMAITTDSTCFLGATLVGTPRIQQFRYSSSAAVYNNSDKEDDYLLRFATAVVTNIQEQPIPTFKVYPNPVIAKTFWIDISNNRPGIYNWTLYDLQGRIVENGSINRSGRMVIPIYIRTNVPHGLYILNIQSITDKKNTLTKLMF